MRFSIEKKMVLAYLPIILVILCIALLSTRSLNELNSINKSIIEEDTFLVQAADKMEDAILAQESYGRRYLILDSQLMLDLFRQRDQEFNELADKILALPHQNNIPIKQLVFLHNQFNTLYTKSDNLISSNSSRQIPNEFDEQVRTIFDKMTALLQKMTLVAKQNQYLKMQEANSIGIRSFRFTALLSTLGIILGLAAASLITRSISHAINQLKRATEIISEGRYDHCPQIHTKDELGDLAGSLRIMALRLSQLQENSLDSSPLTRMPGGMAIENSLIKRLKEEKNLTFCMLDVDNFKSYNDRYGYAKGNEVIRATAIIIESAVAEHGTKEDFVGHIGGDDFAIVTDPEKYEMICKAIIKRFDEDIVYFYNAADRARGHIVSKDRQGRKMTFPLMSISIAVVTTDRSKQMNHIEIGEIAAELKEFAKSIPGSVFVTDRRSKQPESHTGEITPLRIIK